MPRRVMECLTYDTATATCTASAWVERADFPTLTVEEAHTLLAAVLVLFVICYGWKKINWQVLRG